MGRIDHDDLRLDLWPLFGLRLSTAKLELRLPTEHVLLHLVSLAPDDLEMDPAWPALPGSGRAAGLLRWYWRAVGEWKVDHWRLPLAVWSEGELVGFQELEGERFPVLRGVESSSWLVSEARGLGIGKEMRAAVLSLAFDHLGAERAISGAWEWNESSLGVSRSLGYVDNGWDIHEHEGKPGVMRRLVLEKSAWDPTLWPTEVEGLQPCLAWFGGA